MKIKFWQFEYKFDKDDAKIVIPVMLLLIAISATEIDRTILVLITTCYYLLYFFLEKLVVKIKNIIPKPKLKCPKCKSKKIIYKGIIEYGEGVPYDSYYCSDCGKESILASGGYLL